MPHSHSQISSLNQQLDLVAHTLIKSAAVLILCALFTGLYLSLIAMKVVTADLSMALASHLNALLGAFWILSVSYSLRFCHLDTAKLNLMSRSVIIANYGNWGITLLKSHLHVAGIKLTQDMSNNIILILLSLFVVLPAFVGTVIWVRGLFAFKVS
jgi:(hydroxyamino)benzene mutase